jgi:hypothetical protein
MCSTFDVAPTGCVAATGPMYQGLQKYLYRNPGTLGYTGPHSITVEYPPGTLLCKKHVEFFCK